MSEKALLPHAVADLVERVLTSAAGHAAADVRRAAYEYVAALTRGEAPAAVVSAATEPYLRKVALCAYKVLDREVDAMRAAGLTDDDVFEITVAAALSAGVTRMELALAALGEVPHAVAS